MEGSASEWLQAYRNGDVEALGNLVEHTRRPLYGFILRMTSSQHEAEEVFQDVWLRAVKNIMKFDAQHFTTHASGKSSASENSDRVEKKFLSWLFRIAHNRVIDRVRKRKPDFNLEDHREDQADWHERLEAPALLPDHIASTRDLGNRIRDAVGTLPESQREVFLLRTDADLSFKEIARIQETSINTALARMQYALAKLRDLLREDYQHFAQRG